MQPIEHRLKHTSVPAGDGGYQKKPEIEKCDMGSSVEEKQSYLSREPFLLLKQYQTFIKSNMFMVGATLTACMSVDVAEALRQSSLFTFPCKT